MSRGRFLWFDVFLFRVRAQTGRLIYIYVSRKHRIRRKHLFRVKNNILGIREHWVFREYFLE